MADYSEPTPSGSGVNEQPTQTTTPNYFKRWCRRIEAARKLRKDWVRDYKVEKCEKFYVGEQRPEGTEGPRVLNHFLATIRVTQPNLLFENPKFLVRPKPGRAPGVSDREASVAEGVLTAIAQQDDNLDNAASLALLQNFFRVAVLKPVYNPKLVPNEKAGQPVVQRGPGNEPVTDPMGNPQPVVDPSTGQPVMEPDFIVSDDTYRFEWVPAEDMLFPDDGPDMTKWSWLGQEIVVSLEDAQADERFPQELRDQFRSNCTKEHDDDKERANQDKNESDNPDDQLFRYVECYSLKESKWCIIAEGQDFEEPLIEGPLPDGIEDHPYAILLGWIPIVGKEASPWPLPYVYPWLDVQEEYNIRRNQMMQGAKRSARKIFYDEGTFADPDEAVKALQSSRDMEAVKVSDIGRIPIIPPEPPLNASIYQDAPMLLNDYRIISGQTGSKLGNADADTATEATFVERASQLRDVELQKAVNKWLRVAGKKMLQLVKATLTVGLWIKMRGMDDMDVQNYLAAKGIPPQLLQLMPGLKDAIIQKFGQEQLVPVSREDLNFESDVDVVPGSTKPLNLAVERAQFLEFGQLIAQAPQLALSHELLEQFAKRYDFIPQSLVDELHALAMTMMQAQQANAGRGGQNTAKENTQGQGPGASDQIRGDVSQFGTA